MNLNQAVKLIKPKLKLVNFARYMTCSLTINKGLVKQNKRDFKLNFLNSAKCISCSSLSRQNSGADSSDNKHRLMLMDIPRIKFPNPFSLIELRLRIFFQMLQIDKSFGFDSFMMGAEQVIWLILIK
jgi:hypothetical protein